MRWLTPAEAAALVAHANPRVRPILLFMLGTGTRPAETLSLQRHDLHLRSAQAFITRDVGRQSKSGAPRMVALPPPTLAALMAADLPDAGAVFRTPKGNPYVIRAHGGGQIKSAFDTAKDGATRAGVPLGPDVLPYTLRHTWATWFHAATGDFAALMDQGGWAKPDMAMRYRKIAPASLAEDLVRHGWIFERHADAWASKQRGEGD
ncbi:MAG: integrase [Paracoccaceae bacterium]